MKKHMQRWTIFGLCAVLVVCAYGRKPIVPDRDVAEPKAELTVQQMKKLVKGRDKIPESHDLILAYIPAGQFVMGSPKTEVGCQADETRRTVTISQPFYMGITEVTQAQYLNAMHPAQRLFQGPHRKSNS